MRRAGAGARAGRAVRPTDRWFGRGQREAKALALVAGMVAGADSSTRWTYFRHGGMGRLVVPAQTRLLLRQYSDRMGPDGLVWESREQLAERLGVTERTVQRALAAARRAGLLRYVDGGWIGHTVEHQASVPVVGHPAPDRLPVAPVPPWETRRESEPNSHPVSLHPTGRETPAVSPREEESERSERVAVDRCAADEATTTVPAPAVTPCAEKSSNEKGSSSQPLPGAAVTTSGARVDRPLKLSDYGPCWKCSRTTQRYGPGGHRHCASCRAAEEAA